MAGHSKWHNIQHRKGAQDAKRGKVFTKLIKEIVVAAKMGGGVIENNPSLRAVIDKALAANMKRDTIDNAVKRGSGDLEGENYEEIRYEGYGLGGTAIMVDCLLTTKIELYLMSGMPFLNTEEILVQMALSHTCFPSKAL
jgi:YebC/PmpR family DNA-binding regulatory protein